MEELAFRDHLFWVTLLEGAQERGKESVIRAGGKRTFPRARETEQKESVLVTSL